MDWRHPPTDHNSLQLWKVYVKIQPDLVYGIVHRWTKEHGNPFEESIIHESDYDAYEKHNIYRESLRYLITEHK